ncbi:hypothetical protein ABIE33_002328 [Ensifer sp. 4252]
MPLTLTLSPLAGRGDALATQGGQPWPSLSPRMGEVTSVMRCGAGGMQGAIHSPNLWAGNIAALHATLAASSEESPLPASGERARVRGS